MFNLQNIFGAFYGKKEITEDTKAGINKCVSNPEFERELEKGIKEYCEKHSGQTFTMNQIRPMLVDMRFRGFKTHDNRIVGNIMGRIKKKGYFKPTGLYIKSKVGHGTSLQVWIAN